MDNLVSASVDGTVVWSSCSTYLKRGKPGSEATVGEDIHPADELDVAGLPLTATWRVPADIGRRYGAVSGDRNPIHLSALTARAFGFPRAIAHGMWTKARALAALEGRLPAAGTVDVAFKTPLLLPSTVQYATDPVDGGWAFGVRSRDGKPHLAGVVTPIR
jgi:acyl dehydratase